MGSVDAVNAAGTGGVFEQFCLQGSARAILVCCPQPQSSQEHRNGVCRSHCDSSFTYFSLYSLSLVRCAVNFTLIK